MSSFDSIFRSFDNKPRAWRVYTKEQAISDGIDFKPWRECLPGEWGVTDDDYVCQIVKRSGPYQERGRGHTRYHVTLPFTRRWLTSAPLLYDDYKRSGMRPWLTEELGRPRFVRALMMYAKLLVEFGYPLTDKQMKMIGDMYRPDQEIPSASFKRMLRYKETKDMLADKLATILSSQGFTKERIINMYSEAFDIAKENDNAAAMRSVAKDLADMAGMSVTKESSSAVINHELDWDKVEDAKIVEPLQLSE